MAKGVHPNDIAPQLYDEIDLYRFENPDYPYTSTIRFKNPKGWRKLRKSHRRLYNWLRGFDIVEGDRRGWIYGPSATAQQRRLTAPATPVVRGF